MECNFENCGYYADGECNICGMGTDGEDTFCKYCKDNPNCYYKQLAELRAENERLKEDYIKLYQQKDLDNTRWQKRCTDLHIEDKAKADKYWLVLQEIMVITEQLLEKGLEPQSVEHQLRLKGKRELASIILDVITKSESEVK